METPFGKLRSSIFPKSRLVQDLFSKSSKETFPKIPLPHEQQRLLNLQLRPRSQSRPKTPLSPEILRDLQKQCMSLQLKKIMAVELSKNHVKGNLKKIVQQIDAHDCTDFLVLGGGPKSLNYLQKKSGVYPGASFTLEVDVRGYVKENISVDTNNNRMSIKAIKVNGKEKILGILAPSTKALERIQIYPPTNGYLILKYISSD